jgi:hypothetical protein
MLVAEILCTNRFHFDEVDVCICPLKNWKMRDTEGRAKGRDILRSLREEK